MTSATGPGSGHMQVLEADAEHRDRQLPGSERGLSGAGSTVGAARTNCEPWLRAVVPYRAADRYSAWAEKAPTVSSTSPRAMPACLARFSHPSTAEATSSTICLP